MDNTAHVASATASAATVLASITAPTGLAALADDEKAAIKPFVPQITTALVDLAIAALDVGLTRIPVIGGLIASFVNPILSGLTQTLIDKLNEALG